MPSTAQPSTEEVLELARRHESVEQVTAEFTGGANHLVYCLDDTYVLKVPRPAQDVTPLANEVVILRGLPDPANLPHPRLLGYGLGERGSRPYMLLTRAEGACLEETGASWPQRPQAMRSLAAALRTLHSLDASRFVLVPPYDMKAYLEQLWQAGLTRLEADGHLTEDRQAELNQRWLSALDVLLETGNCLVHADVRPPHLFFDQSTGRLTSLIDFADARLGAPELEFFFMWLRWWANREDVGKIFDYYFGAPDAPAPRLAAADLRLFGAVCRCGHPLLERRTAAIEETLAITTGARPGRSWS